jgi:hypothetical protein
MSRNNIYKLALPKEPVMMYMEPAQILIDRVRALRDWRKIKMPGHQYKEGSTRTAIVVPGGRGRPQPAQAARYLFQRVKKLMMTCHLIHAECLPLCSTS